MPANTGTQPPSIAESVAIKGRMLPLNVATIHGDNAEAAAVDLIEKIASLPKMLAGMPLYLEVVQPGLDIQKLVASARARGQYPAALLGGTAEQVEQARLCGLPAVQSIVGSGRSVRQSNPEQAEVPSVEQVTPPKPAAAEQPESQALPAKLVTKPVRSGQQIYAKDSDLIITTSVSAGAEVIADGNIHIYGALRGRALAGVKGNVDARIFCSQLGAELISIAGHYRVAEDLDGKQLGRAVQVRLDDEKLIIERQGQ